MLLGERTFFTARASCGCRTQTLDLISADVPVFRYFLKLYLPLRLQRYSFINSLDCICILNKLSSDCIVIICKKTGSLEILRKTILK